ncbi:MAG TPA: isoaspartyl peptidase/L-asparaginase [candidate division Zixibacteria bacterium]|nr:isoaspartyl peptidase/L-asparaginase [candidate division Zixibacteria bacterium]MDD4917308.1 isoaspartyl peptidase/L-asparaginase [candidate division Zixibacteria bacterium]MDM7971544.1 isoaspartyl peptidase/L-asparaginase [candidate division Zixibacteria bacterium]HOD65462.1 isoaspartyl peptidase/L-asparaginase [candidate division Zixibacteria bacterium]HPM36762.1 isoaspartyl peptidase/L-asparaginase [candidate division Zixibacteria bacterium]
MPQAMNAHPPFAIAIHGGAGTILKEKLTPALEAEYLDGLRRSLAAGYQVLDRGGRALDAVQAAVNVMEDSHLFNAGKGAVFTHEGFHEQDACIMDGAGRAVGAAAMLRRVRNPINLARAILEYSPHVLLAGEGAEKFAQEHGVRLVEPEYFYTEQRWQQLQQALAKERQEGGDQTRLDHSDDRDKTGTVGAVALDRAGNLAAATSTGGMTNKRFGRIGDSPIIGAGIWADNATCAVSATGVGEYIMRAVAAYDIAALMAYRGLSLAEAADEVVTGKLTALGGQGGVVAVDRAGTIAMPFNSPGMYRGYRYPGRDPVVKIFRDE